MVVKAQFAPLLLLISLLASPSAAQDAIPETPPELKDFRLDPQPPAAGPEPRIEPRPTLPVATEQPPAATEPVQRETAQPRSQPQRQIPPRQSAPANAAPSGSPATPAVQNSDTVTPESVADVGNDPAPAPAPQTDAAPVAADMAEPDFMLWWKIAAGLGVGAILLMGAWLFRRRTKQSRDFVEVTAPMVEVDHVQIAERMPIPAKPAVPAKAASRPRLSLTFVPEKATLSFTALTVKGQLRLINEGDALAENMQLRATLFSASADQDKTIAAFHSGAFGIPVEQLGEAKPGERIGMDIEMSVPVAELQSYSVGDRRIFVPLVVADLEYGWDDGSDSARLACIVGREAQPPASKMGPLRLDLGPRSFAPLGQRPVFA